VDRHDGFVGPNGGALSNAVDWVMQPFSVYSDNVSSSYLHF